MIEEPDECPNFDNDTPELCSPHCYYCSGDAARNGPQDDSWIQSTLERMAGPPRRLDRK